MVKLGSPDFLAFEIDFWNLGWVFILWLRTKNQASVFAFRLSWLRLGPSAEPWSRSVSGSETLEHKHAIRWVHTTCKLQLFYWTIILCENIFFQIRVRDVIKPWKSYRHKIQDQVQNQRDCNFQKSRNLSEHKFFWADFWTSARSILYAAYTHPYS